MCSLPWSRDQATEEKLTLLFSVLRSWLVFNCLNTRSHPRLGLTGMLLSQTHEEKTS